MHDQGPSNNSETDSCIHSQGPLGGSPGVLWQVREQWRVKHWGYVTAIMAVYLAAAERKLGFWPACLPSEWQMHTHAANQQSGYCTLSLICVRMSDTQHMLWGWGSMCTFLRCIREGLMEQSAALWEQPCFCGSRGFPLLQYQAACVRREGRRENKTEK